MNSTCCITSPATLEVFSRLALLEQVWGYQHEGYEHTVNTHINRLRSKIERDPPSRTSFLPSGEKAISSPW